VCRSALCRFRTVTQIEASTPSARARASSIEQGNLHLPPLPPYTSSLSSHTKSATKMAFIVRRPFALTCALKQAPKSTAQVTLRSFQTHAPKQAFRQQSPLQVFAHARNDAFKSAFRQNGGKRGYQTGSGQIPNPVAQGNLTQRLLYGGGSYKPLGPDEAAQG
jgi:hypothetical protein